MSLSTQHWQYLHGGPLATGVIKQQPDDFIVEECLGFELTGEGEHHVLWIEKLNTNTAFVAEQLSAFSGIPLRDIAYAGRKDKYARTRQYFSVYQGKHSTPDWSRFSCPNVSILAVTRHNKKFRLGALAGNKFALIIRDFHIDDIDKLARRMELISQHGVPNYYGQQRFGEMHTSNGIRLNGNLDLALKMSQGEKIKNRNKRSMAISALRSWLFNELVSKRIEHNLHQTILLGDALQLSGSNSFFVVKDNDDTSVLNERLKQKDIGLTAPLYGEGKAIVQSAARDFEEGAISGHSDLIDALAGLGLKQERRAIMLFPNDLKWHYESGTLHISFMLPAGSFATSVIHELVNTNSLLQD
jgi:tRNA pseudouridine13 synthase